MSSIWSNFEQADTTARQAHAGRIAAISDLLDTYPAVSLVGLICARRQVSAQTARDWVREAVELRERPDLDRAAARGELSGDQITALRVLAEPGTDGAWIETLASPLTTDDFRINELQRMARKKRAQQLERRDGGRYLTMTATPDERFVRGRFQLHPEEAAALEHQLDARVPTNTKLRDFPTAHADALMTLVTDAAAGRHSRTRDGMRTTVVVRTTPEVLDATSDQPGELPNHTFIPAHVVRDIAANSKVVELDISNVNLDTKQIPDPVRRWVHHRDGGHCRGIDCTTPTLDLEEHHLTPRSQGGTHHPSNLILLCVVCHQIRVHREGWRITGNAEGQVTWIKPDGTPYTPPPIINRARSPDA